MAAIQLVLEDVLVNVGSSWQLQQLLQCSQVANAARDSLLLAEQRQPQPQQQQRMDLEMSGHEQERGWVEQQQRQQHEEQHQHQHQQQQQQQQQHRQQQHRQQQQQQQQQRQQQQQQQQQQKQQRRFQQPSCSSFCPHSSPLTWHWQRHRQPLQHNIIVSPVVAVVVCLLLLGGPLCIGAAAAAAAPLLQNAGFEDTSRTEEAGQSQSRSLPRTSSFSSTSKADARFTTAASAAAAAGGSDAAGGGRAMTVWALPGWEVSKGGVMLVPVEVSDSRPLPSAGGGGDAGSVGGSDGSGLSVQRSRRAIRIPAVPGRSISQTVPTQKGCVYRGSFRLASQWLPGSRIPASVMLSVVGKRSKDQLFFDVFSEKMTRAWTTKLFRFKADGPATLLVFGTGVVNGSYNAAVGAAIDDVALEEDCLGTKERRKLREEEDMFISSSLVDVAPEDAFLEDGSAAHHQTHHHRHERSLIQSPRKPPPRRPSPRPSPPRSPLPTPSTRIPPRRRPPSPPPPKRKAPTSTRSLASPRPPPPLTPPPPPTPPAPPTWTGMFDGPPLRAILIGYNADNAAIAGNNVSITFNVKGGSRWQSMQHTSAVVNADIQCPTADTSGLRLYFGLASMSGGVGRQDGISFEFVGNNRTHVWANLVVGGRLSTMPVAVPFDCGVETHRFSIYWDANNIAWYIDGTPVRVHLRSTAGLKGYPLRPLFLFGSLSSAAWTWAAPLAGPLPQGASLLMLRTASWQDIRVTSPLAANVVSSAVGQLLSPPVPPAPTNATTLYPIVPNYCNWNCIGCDPSNRNGNATIRNDNYCGSRYSSAQPFAYGVFMADVKCPAGGRSNSGMIQSFYTSSQEGSAGQDEIDFEWMPGMNRLQINTYVFGKSIHFKSEVLPFDCSADFHNYALLWTPRMLVWYVDFVPWSVYRNTTAFDGLPYPTKPQFLYASVWDASGICDGCWAGKRDPSTTLPGNTKWEIFAEYKNIKVTSPMFT